MAHLKAAKKLLNYLSSTCDYCLLYGAIEDVAPVGYTDSDFASCRITARSTYGYVFLVGGGPVS
jgi:hypothetical protein